MAAWSCVLSRATRILARPKGQLVNLLTNNSKSSLQGAKRCMSDHSKNVMVIEPTRFDWHRFKDYFHFYFFLGAIPMACLITYVNVFIGPATLTEIPDDYVPQFYEYQKHPISRFFAKYIHSSPQKEYEKYMAYLHYRAHQAKVRGLRQQADKGMSEYQDIDSIYYRRLFGAKQIYNYRMYYDERYGRSPTYLWE